MKKAVVTLCSESFMTLGQYSHPSFIRYAEKVGADFIVINDKHRKYPSMDFQFEKYQMGELLDTYNRIIYVDTDAFIKPECEDLFNIVPYDCIGGTYCNEGNVSADENLINIISDTLGHVGWKHGLLNDGVLVLSDIHKNIYTIPPNIPPLWLWNLYLVSYNIYRFGHKIFKLHHKYNGMFIYGYHNKTENDTDALIVHYAACGDLRPKRLKYLYEKYLQ